MIIALEIDERRIRIFRDEREVKVYAEEIDVEDGNWLFFDVTGVPLKAVFENKSWFRRFIARGGPYHLEQDDTGMAATLDSYLTEVRLIEEGGKPISVEQLRVRMASNNSLQARRP